MLCRAGCRTEDVVTALGLTMADLFPAASAGSRTSSRKHANTQTPPGDCTLHAYAEAKGLDEAFLRSLGISDTSWPAKGGTPALRIPYRDADGAEVAVRYRINLEGPDRFRWRTRSKPRLYGLERLGQSTRRGPFTAMRDPVALVEGESDCHTLWQHGFRALGLPGAGTWRDDWAAALDGVAEIYVVVEPDAGGEAVVRRLATSRLRDRARLIRLDGAKDPSALYQSDPEHFADRWQAALAAAVPFGELEAVARAEQLSEAWERCEPLATTPRIVECFGESIAATVAGERRVVQLLYLALVSRLLERPVSVAIKGPSAGGKSWIVEQVLAYFPPEAYHALTAMSDRALAYGDEPLAHRHLVLFEAAGLSSDIASYLVRSLLSEGRLRYETVEKTAEGLVPRVIERDGPTGLIVTTTAVHLHPENETRLLSLTVTDSAEQTRAVLATLADEDRPAQDLASWQALQTWLAGTDARVTIPYAKALAAGVPAVAVRLRRDFGAVLNLIRAHALLHQASRERDAAGRVVATLDDYRVVRDLVADLVADNAGSTVSPATRATVGTVAQLAGGADTVTVTAVAQHLRLDQSAAWRRVRVALDRGHLRNLEERPRRPARLVLGDPLPEDVPILPPPEGLQVCAVDDKGDARAPDAPSVGQAATAPSIPGMAGPEPASDRQLDAWLAAPPPDPGSDEDATWTA